MGSVHESHWSALCALGIAAGLLSACGGGGGGDSGAESRYVSFTGNANGEYVVDAHNRSVRFRADTRTMETAGKTPTDITLDASDRLVKGGNVVVGNVRDVAGANNTVIKGMQAPDGTMLDVDDSSGTTTLKKTDIRFDAPGGGGTGSEPSGTSSSGGAVSHGGLDWTLPAGPFSWSQANAHCRSQGRRLPTLNEIRDMYLAGAIGKDWKRQGTWTSDPQGPGVTVAYYVYDLSGAGYGIGYENAPFFNNSYHMATCVR